jgi:hypothetical protein
MTNIDRVTFWSTESIETLLNNGRQDLKDRGDAYAERISALLLTSNGIVDKLINSNSLYCGVGGGQTANIMELEHLVNGELAGLLDTLESFVASFQE